jgi:F-type H+-transporting ATPase subunit a
MLINFIVIIELVRNIIRPITLSVRLCANIVAGHLLLRLLRNFSITSFTLFTISFSGIVILGLLEIAVALIQSYVFITLSSLYATEIHYE